jgi:hypothetical protein
MEGPTEEAGQLGLGEDLDGTAPRHEGLEPLEGRRYGADDTWSILGQPEKAGGDQSALGHDKTLGGEVPVPEPGEEPEVG